ncbi:pre-mRNA-splicing factor CWC22 homolog [Dreissena polymorpha]|uniref:pre-mRNA-splicing factor CWC22 homolog n=1 Tax=Dreissena polymorpha TaxID=45954 RepID=UPI002263ED48|nr:pre-mRNA-splicing factor CWC22 homolog [Dreissena polymorpha]
MKRNHIHMAMGEPGDNCVTSGMRSSCEVTIRIDLKKAMEDGIKFFVSANNVILSPGNEDGLIPPKYFELVMDRKKGARIAVDLPIAKQADDQTEKKKKEKKKDKKGKEEKSDDEQTPNTWEDQAKNGAKITIHSPTEKENDKKKENKKREDKKEKEDEPLPENWEEEDKNAGLHLLSNMPVASAVGSVQSTEQSSDCSNKRPVKVDEKFSTKSEELQYWQIQYFKGKVEKQEREKQLLDLKIRMLLAKEKRHGTENNPIGPQPEPSTTKKT